MAIFRNVNMSFWTDTKVTDDYTPEERYFMLYALTNSYTNVIGCYEISIKQMSNDLGYTKDVIENLLERFSKVHKTIEYDCGTKELLILNWSKYNWNASPKLNSSLLTNIAKVKSDRFYNQLARIYNERETIEEILPLRDTEEQIEEIVLFKEELPVPKKTVEKIDYKAEFEEVWKEYPKKQGKANALKSYEKARKRGVDKQTILDGIFAYLDYIQAEKTDFKYIKQGSTWFNQECWNDDYSVRRQATTADLAEKFDFSEFRN